MNTMNRCPPLPSARYFGLLSLVAAILWVCGPATAQTTPRQFPPSAKRALLQVMQPPDILLNGAPERLSPGARIKGVTNMMVMSGALVGTPVLVNYQRDMQGLIHEVWILSAEEAQQKREGMAPVTNFVFESEALKPKTDDGKTPFDQLPRYPGQ
jgi:hypothetical protein